MKNDIIHNKQIVFLLRSNLQFRHNQYTVVLNWIILVQSDHVHLRVYHQEYEELYLAVERDDDRSGPDVVLRLMANDKLGRLWVMLWKKVYSRKNLTYLPVTRYLHCGQTYLFFPSLIGNPIRIRVACLPAVSFGGRARISNFSDIEWTSKGTK